MIITKTPFRISFFGGGTDYPDYLSVSHFYSGQDKGSCDMTQQVGLCVADKFPFFTSAPAVSW